MAALGSPRREFLDWFGEVPYVQYCAEVFVANFGVTRQSVGLSYLCVKNIR